MIRTDLTQKDRVRARKVTRPTEDFTEAERFERMAGGASTSKARLDRKAFSHPSANLNLTDRHDFFIGNSLFERIWVSSPSSTASSDGLGPLFNARSCNRCHLSNGRGHAPTGPDDGVTSALVRLSVPPSTAQQHADLASLKTLRIPEPNYGGQFHDVAVPGLAAEGRLTVRYEETEVTLAGGETASLRKPIIALEDLGYGPMADNTMTSLRVANPMIGLGLLEAIHEADILALADPADADGDGISGRPSRVRDPLTGEITLGRFGWKASMPTVKVQSADAFAGDIGISTSVFRDPYGDCVPGQHECRAMPNGIQVAFGDFEAPDPVLELVAFYARNLAVPARRDLGDKEVLAGKELFYKTGCAACHTPKFVTSRNATDENHAFQLIWPYTDLLLHDMGEGLADHRPVGTASGREWRTPPLWGIGLTQTVNGHTNFLHDGRARNLLEAILWHGGEAEAARETVVAMSPRERAALIRFLESL
ncbi:MAG: di-heme oxidoredictase family protein [Pseudomonadota bacterium]